MKPPMYSRHCSCEHGHSSTDAANKRTHLISQKTLCPLLTLVPSTEWVAWYSVWTHTDLCVSTVQNQQF